MTSPLPVCDWSVVTWGSGKRQGNKWADLGKRGEWDGADPVVAVSVEWEEQGGAYREHLG